MHSSQIYVNTSACIIHAEEILRMYYTDIADASLQSAYLHTTAFLYTSTLFFRGMYTYMCIYICAMKSILRVAE